MASTSVDEFLLNFDLNQLANQENVQTLEQKYEKLRKSMSWLKSKIITTDFAIQKYQAKKDDYDQSIKAHTITREELRKVCINYNEATEKCALLENENKILLADREVFKERVIDLENKYGAIISHTNQLQMLVKQLEDEKDALKVERELDNMNHKDRNQELIVLQKEKDAMFNDLVSLKDVILGKKKTCRRYVKLLKKYVKDIKMSKEFKFLSTSEESDNDMDSYGNISLNIETKFNKIHDVIDKELISSAEQNFNENYSDGEVSVDTGRGSSLANSHDKYLSSPDSVVTLETLMKIPIKDAIKQIDAATSPIPLYPTVSVATSPIVFDHSVPVFEDQYDDYADCFDGTEYLMDGIPLSEDIHVIQEQESYDDSIGPVSDVYIKESIANSPVKLLFIDPDESNACHHDLIIEKQIPRGMCEKSDNLKINDKKKFIDACTSPVPELIDLPKFVDAGTNTDKHDESLNIGQTGKFENQTPTCCDKSIGTDTIFAKFVNTSTSPIVYDNCKFVNIGINTDNDMVRASHNDFELPGINEKISARLNKRTLSKSSGNSITHSTEELRTQEKLCLENNSSKNLYFESTNDTEVQNILNVMKLHHDLISPISKTPFDSHCLKLLPEMNATLTKIWTTITKMYKMPHEPRNINPNSLNPIEIDEIDEILEADTISHREDYEQRVVIDKGIFQDLQDDNIIDKSHRNNGESIDKSTDSSGSGSLNMPSNEDQTLIKSKRTKCHTSPNTLFPNSITDKNIVIAQADNSEEEIYSHQHNLPTNLELNDISQDNINKNEIIATARSKNENDLQQEHIVKYTEFNECENNLNNSTNNELCKPTEAPIAHTIIIHGTRTKKKSKLEKLRNKLLPTCKIKKITPPIIKKTSKVCNIIPKDTANSALLNQKLAYENAVKVMAELRSTQQLQKSKKSPKDVVRERKSNSSKIQSSSSEAEMLLTRSRSRRLSKKEDAAVTTSFEKSLESEQSKNDNEKSPGNRKVRKRSADIEVDSLRSSCKRILRSSNVTNEEAKQLHNDNNKSNFVDKGQSKSAGYIEQSLIDSKNDDKCHIFNLENHKQSCDPITQCEQLESVKSNVTFEKSKIKRMKPVIELSNCLADNANVVSIIPGNVGYFDVNKHFNDTRNNATAILEGDQCNQSNTNQLNLEINDGVNLTENIVKSSNTCRDNINNNLFVETNNEPDIKHENNNDQRSTIAEQEVQDNCESVILKQQEANICSKNPVVQLTQLKNDVISNKNNVISYSDLDLYSVENNVEHNISSSHPKKSQSRKENILCAALDRYGVISVKYAAKKVPDNITNTICKKIEESIPNIIASTKDEQKNKMNDLVNSIQNYKTKYILAGLMKYLKDPTRKNELFNKIINGPAPPMTKSEVILLYVIETLNGSLPTGFINRVWNNMEHALFQLNRAPEFDVIESMSHFYAVSCRYFRSKSRLRCFMLDAMYCLQFKAVPLIRQCLDVCPGVLPNAHEHMAKTSLVTCLVYLLHFYKCDDRFNRAQDIRNILNRKYQYRFSEWNETMILEIFRKAIMDLRGTQNDKKMLRVALIILCKRHGAKWCQQNIIQNILLPIIEKKDVPERIKQFCVLMLGPLLKPFPADRKAQCEIVINQLLQMLKQNPSHGMNESIYSSLIFMNKHDQERVVQALMLWNPEKVSPDFEEILNDYVMEKPLAAWKKLVTRKPSQCN